MLEVKQLSFAFGKHQILDEVSFTVGDGQIIGLVAPNGTGKTTLLSLLCGLLPSGKAEINLNGENLKKNRVKFLEQIFFLESSNHLYYDLNVLDHLKYVEKMWHSKVNIEETLAELEMTDYKKKKIKHLSLGMKQHVLLAMYLVSDAKMLLIDEPLNGLDPTSIQQFEKIFRDLKSQGKSLLVSSHQMDSVGRISDTVFFLRDQKIQVEENAGQDMMHEYTSMFLDAEDRHD
ncbi:ABC transporter ATP-binding protein [Enterococcus timonensis]|uniref:ABC transporter ATP-binding protein n=1 Tax=Enterococcus timonensis TaxID=1852364 RepID=UPI0008DA21ED|nr:ABC transporter ATP-binding protein [Enterococcus timonensis]